MIINSEYLLANCPLPVNYRTDELMQYVPLTESIWIRPILGDALFDEIQQQIDEDNLSEENATLLVDGSVWRLLSFAVCLEALALIWAHMSEVSVTKGHSDNSDALSLKEISYVEQHLRRQVEALKEQLIDFLNTYCNQYPLFGYSDCCHCACCGDKLGLKKPNPNNQLYKARGKNTTIR